MTPSIRPLVVAALLVLATATAGFGASPDALATGAALSDAALTAETVEVTTTSADLGDATAAEAVTQETWPAAPSWAASAGPASCTECYSRSHCRSACGGICGRDVGLHCGTDPDQVYCFCGF